MAVTGMHYNSAWAFGGDNGYSYSVQYNFSPTPSVAQTSLSVVAGGGGFCTSGITQYRIRPVPNGPDQDINFGWNYIGAFPPSVNDPNMTSVTAEMQLGGGDQSGYMTLNIWFWD